MTGNRKHSVAALLRENTQLCIQMEFAKAMIGRAEAMLHEVSEGTMPPREVVEAWLNAYDEHFSQRDSE